MADQNLWVYETVYLEDNDRMRQFLTPGAFIPFAAREKLFWLAADACLRL